MAAVVENELRRKIESKIEALIGLLDDLDGDPDLEPYLAGSDPADADREHDDCDLEEGGDAEPDLGGSGHWTDAGLQYDLEEDRTDMESVMWTEAEAAAGEYAGSGFYCWDSEPSLGWTERHGAGFTEDEEACPRDDRENDAGDNPELEDEIGNADLDGLSEQWPGIGFAGVAI